MKAASAFLVSLLLSAPAWAGSECSDLSRALSPRPSFQDAAALASKLAPGAILQKSGDLEDGVHWAEVSGTVDRPLEQILGEMRAHQAAWTTNGVDEMSIDQVNDGGFTLHQRVRYKMKPFLFITIAWTEDWAYRWDGSLASAPEVRVAYRKSEGTSHIAHLCGSISLRRLSPTSTQVSIYQEEKATSRSREGSLNGIRATVETLRKDHARRGAVSER